MISLKNKIFKVKQVKVSLVNVWTLILMLNLFQEWEPVATIFLVYQFYC